MGRKRVYSEHAISRMALRLISEFEIILTLNNPDYTAPGDLGATNFYKLIEGRTIRVTSKVVSQGTGKKKETIETIVTVAVKDKE